MQNSKPITTDHRNLTALEIRTGAMIALLQYELNIMDREKATQHFISFERTQLANWIEHLKQLQQGMEKP